MKSKIALFSIFLLLTISIQAQPGCDTQSFNPYDNYHYGDADHVIYGSAFDFIVLKDWVKFTGNNLFFSQSNNKLKIKILENLKGRINEKLIEVYVGYDCGHLLNRKTAIYKLKKAFLGATAVWITEKISYAMNDYSDMGREEILKKVKSDLATNNQRNLFGVVVEKFSDERSYKFNDEMEVKLGYYPKSFKPMVGITVEAKRMSDDRIFKTVTDNQGKFKFTNLAYGEYQVYPILAEGYERIGVVTNPPINSQQRYDLVEIRKNWSNTRHVFDIEQLRSKKDN